MFSIILLMLILAIDLILSDASSIRFIKKEELYYDMSYAFLIILL